MAIMPQHGLFSREDVEELGDLERARKLLARLKKRHPELVAAGIGRKGGDAGGRLGVSAPAGHPEGLSGPLRDPPAAWPGSSRRRLTLWTLLPTPLRPSAAHHGPVVRPAPLPDTWTGTNAAGEITQPVPQGCFPRITLSVSSRFGRSSRIVPHKISRSTTS